MMRDHVPAGPGQLTAAWLDEALRPSGALGDARVTSVSATPMAEERGIGGRVLRLRLGYDRPAPAAPETLVAKLPSAIALTRTGGRFLRLPEREVRFYRELATEVPLRTPRCYASAIDEDGDAFVLLLEDLGALAHGDDVEGASVGRVEAIVEAVGRLHAAWWDAPRLRGLDWMPTIGELGSTWQRMFAVAWREHRDALGSLVPGRARPLAERLTRRLAPALARLEASPPTLLHGDLRLDNLFFPAEGGLAAVDWSNATRGPGPYDLAYLFCTAFTPEQRRAHEEALLHRYHEALRGNGVEGYPFARCFDDYRLSFVEPFARMFFLVVRGHAEKASDRPTTVLSKFVRNAGEAALDLGVDGMLEA